MNHQAQPSAISASPFHAGEREVQTRSGVRDEAEKRGQRMLTADLNAQQLQFFQQLPFVIAAHTDGNGQPWAGLITSKTGFFNFQSNNQQLDLRWSQARNLTGVEARPGNSLGFLGIELATKRRNRLNATVFANDDAQWRLVIDQAYGNCPKYISEREWPSPLFERRYTLNESQGLNNLGKQARQLINNTDTFFIATSSGPALLDASTQSSAWGADVSHRGGEPGFLSITDNTLTFKDYPGNNMFNTLGNLQQYSPCGLLLIDFTTGALLQIAARAKLDYRENEDAVERRVSLTVEQSKLWIPAG